MMNSKILFVLFGTEELISDFKEIHDHFDSKKSIHLNSLDGLGDQVKFLIDDDQFDDKNTIFVTVNNYKKKTFEYILSETKDIKGLIIKFVVLNDKAKKDDEDIVELVSAIEEFSKSVKNGENKDFHDPKLPLDQNLYNSLNDINVLSMNLDNLSYIVDICLLSYGVESINELPRDVKEEINNSILKSVKKYNDII